MILQPDNLTPASFDVQNVTSSLALNKAVGGSAALFSLYLAISEARGDEQVKWTARQEPVEDPDFPARLNHYRRSPLASTAENVNSYLRWQAGLKTTFSNEHIRLWQAISPDPLSFHNNSQRLEPEVKQNCPYRTQLGWVTEKSSQIKESDATLLADTIPASQAIAV
ncbi:VC2046/SO_2500 family protein [uncultured Alteromonas sp.]|jgi:hypothetical protein|uniref:VC2046/SO_2500 family protein n=1 Tax=uncultured Alteromonas sp. TaxID=179113 RepID=UPI0025EA70C3|nr:VC2046/SO_2500 family protein [uncultured Alteromonas sp.]